jgi:probable HAF family extracellular repeat protein
LSPGDSSVANAINNNGLIVGQDTAPYPDPSATAFISGGTPGTLTNLNYLIDPSSGWTLQDAYGINDNGWIVGYGTDASGKPTAFLLTPVAAGPPPPEITAASRACAGSTGNTASGPASETSYSWTITGGTIASGANSQTVTYDVDPSGSADVVLSLSAPTGKNSLTLPINALPTASVSGSATIIDGIPATIQAALTGNPPWNVTWSDGAQQNGVVKSPTTRTVSPTATTVYTVTALSDATCTASSDDLSGSATMTVAPFYVITDLGTLGGAVSYAYGIDASGQVVGWSWTAGGRADAFLYSGGVMTDLNRLLPQAAAGNSRRRPRSTTMVGLPAMASAHRARPMRSYSRP